MKTLGRSLLLAAAVGVASAPTAVAAAEPDVPGSVRVVAEQAADVAVEERTLLEIASATNLDEAQRAEIEDRITAVDARGVELLTQLDRLDVDLTQAIRISLGPLAPGTDRARQPAVYVPTTAVYDAAAADLRRIATNPEAVTNAPGDSNPPAFGLLAVAALALLALGAAALGNSLRRQPDPELEAMAWRDGLTGLANRRRLDADLARYEESERPTSAIMVDIDHFKAINDTFGHAFGDEVLRLVGEAIARQVRSGDVVYRYGGEEFCVLLPGATPDDARAVADRVVAAVREVELPDGRHITVSVGLAGAPQGDPAGAVHRATRAMSSAKEDGRDRAVASDDHPAAV